MDDEMRKRLTEYLGEYWHEPLKRNGKVSEDECVFYGVIFFRDNELPRHIKKENRTFTTPDDMMALKDKLVEKGDWEEFYKFAWKVFCKEPFYQVDEWLSSACHMTAWLLYESRFCNLVGEWQKARDL